MPWRFLAVLPLTLLTAVAEELHFRSEQELLQGLEDAAVEEQAAIADELRKSVSNCPNSTEGGRCIVHRC